MVINNRSIATLAVILIAAAKSINTPAQLTDQSESSEQVGTAEPLEQADASVLIEPPESVVDQDPLPSSDQPTTTTIWSPLGTWSGQFRRTGTGDNLYVNYWVCADGKMDVQINLAPLNEHFYTVKNTNWQELEVSFDLYGKTHCTLRRIVTTARFSGHCINANGKLSVSEITIDDHNPNENQVCR